MESSPTTILNFLLSLYKMIKERTIKPESACGMVEEDEYVEKYMGGRQYTTVAGGRWPLPFFCSSCGWPSEGVDPFIMPVTGSPRLQPPKRDNQGALPMSEFIGGPLYTPKMDGPTIVRDRYIAPVAPRCD